MRRRCARLARAGAAASSWPASGSKTSSPCSAASSPGPVARRFAVTAPANTDDRPVVAYRAPRVTYAPDSSPRDRLIALLRELSIAAGRAAVGPPADPAWPRRLAAYWVARDRFVESGRDVRPSPRVEEMLAQVREPLLAVLRISPDFRPAYDPLLSMASGARSNRMFPAPARCSPSSRGSSRRAARRRSCWR